MADGDLGVTGGDANLAESVLASVRSELGEQLWSNRLSDAERELLKAVCADAANVLFLAAKGATWEAARERAQIEAQVANLSSVGSAKVSRAVWSAVAVAARAALAVVLA